MFYIVLWVLSLVLGVAADWWQFGGKNIPLLIVVWILLGALLYLPAAWGGA